MLNSIIKTSTLTVLLLSSNSCAPKSQSAKNPSKKANPSQNSTDNSKGGPKENSDTSNQGSSISPLSSKNQFGTQFSSQWEGKYIITYSGKDIQSCVKFSTLASQCKVKYLHGTEVSSGRNYLKGTCSVLAENRYFEVRIDKSSWPISVLSSEKPFINAFTDPVVSTPESEFEEVSTIKSEKILPGACQGSDL